MTSVAENTRDSMRERERGWRGGRVRERVEGGRERGGGGDRQRGRERRWIRSTERVGGGGGGGGGGRGRQTEK